MNPKIKLVELSFSRHRVFTANKIDETTPHPEVRKATIEIKGEVGPNKSGFNPLKDVIKYQYYTVRDIKITEDEPYPKINSQNYGEKIKSSKEKFFVVKESGMGFYHSLVNLSNKWVLLVLEKELRLHKIPDLSSKTLLLDKNQQKIFTLFYEKLLLYGDAIFEKENRLVKDICNFDVDKITPLLIEMLNVLETGKHEACMVYAIILKLGKIDKKVLNYLEEALRNKTAPEYYLKELITKLSDRII